MRDRAEPEPSNQGGWRRGQSDGKAEAEWRGAGGRHGGEELAGSAALAIAHGRLDGSDPLFALLLRVH